MDEHMEVLDAMSFGGSKSRREKTSFLISSCLALELIMRKNLFHCRVLQELGKQPPLAKKYVIFVIQEKL
jgi:hypothetical protein